MESTSALSAILRYWKSVLALALLGTLLGTALVFATGKQYSSTAELFLSIQIAETTGEISQTSQYARDQATNFATMATSERVLAPTIKDLGLDVTVADLAQHITADVPLDSSAITLTVKYSDPEQAADIANAAAEHLIETVTALSPKVNNKTSPVALTKVDTATADSTPVSPSIPLYIIGGLVLGALVGAAIALAQATTATRRTGERAAAELA